MLARCCGRHSQQLLHLDGPTLETPCPATGHGLPLSLQDASFTRPACPPMRGARRRAPADRWLRPKCARARLTQRPVVTPRRWRLCPQVQR